jgi:hypothetical protein
MPLYTTSNLHTSFFLDGKEAAPKQEDKENEEGEKASQNSAQDTKDKTASGEGTKTSDCSLLADSPVLHMAAVRQQRERANLLRNLGPFRKALCARRDLEIRRQMCKVDKVSGQGFFLFLFLFWGGWARLVQWLAHWTSDRKVDGSRPGLDSDHILSPISSTGSLVSI